MGWFSEQIKKRKKLDDENFSDAMEEIAASVLRQRAAPSSDSATNTKSAIAEILSYYKIKIRDIPEGVTDPDDQLEYYMRPHGVMSRRVKLEEGWYKDAAGPMLAKTESGNVIALIPGVMKGYSYFDHVKGKKIKVNAKTVKQISEEATVFYRPFPPKKLGISALWKYIFSCISPSALLMLVAVSLLTTLVGMISPKITNIIFSDVIENGSVSIILAISVFSICVSISILMMSAVKSLITGRISTEMSISVQAATMARILSLPASFFRNYSAGELTSKAQYVNTLCNTLFSTFAVTGLTSLLSLIYISQVFTYAPGLVLPALGVTFATLLFSVITTLAQIKIDKAAMELSSKNHGMTYAMITGIQKIKLSGSEKRAFARWGRHYNEEIKLEYGRPMPLLMSGVIGTAISLIGTIVMYFFAVRSNVSLADYYAFNAAYGMVSGAFSSAVSIALRAASIRPTLEMAKPIMEAEPEVSDGKQLVTRLTGSLELSHVSFRYSDNMPLVIDDLSLKIRPGQYVAIVGKTGCGKSTLMRLLLGFEQPQKGAVYYDGKDISSLDVRSLRKNIGVVMQNGKLFQGDLYSNITISAPWLTLDEAWKAAEIASIADDIRAMPMGMHTVVGEGGSGFSGGQKQRLMIARAVASEPKILMLDEATSALDNITQKKISEALDKLKCTRIVIAHRLSTIRHCDRIILLENGKIVEDGTYDELIAKDGAFSELVRRQQINT